MLLGLSGHPDALIAIADVGGYRGDIVAPVGQPFRRATERLARSSC